MTDELEPRPLRLHTAAFFVAVLACFFLPFLSVEASGRTAEARGVELAADRARFAGAYTHVAYEGEVERVVDVTRVPSAVALLATLVGAALALLPGRRMLWSTFAAALLVLLGLLWFAQASSQPYSPPVSDRRLAAWLALTGAVGLVGLLGWRLRRERDLGAEAPDLFAHRR